MEPSGDPGASKLRPEIKKQKQTKQTKKKNNVKSILKGLEVVSKLKFQFLKFE